MPYELTFDILWQTHKYIPLLRREVLVEFISEDGDQEPSQRQIALLDSLDTLTEEINSKLANLAREDFKTRLENWGITPQELYEEIEMEIDEQNIQNHFKIEQVVIPPIRNCSFDYVFMCGNCDWDEEHGIEFLLKNGEPVQCNAQGGLASGAEWNDYLAKDGEHI
jgi:hypothetical protein